ALALPDSIVFAQVSGLGTAGAPTEERNEGDGRDRNAPTTVRIEGELKLSFEAPALSKDQCEAVASTGYHQRNEIARVNSTLEITDCAAASGAFTIALRIRDRSGESKTLEFNETWQRSDEKDVAFTADYPIGENAELISTR